MIRYTESGYRYDDGELDPSGADPSTRSYYVDTTDEYGNRIQQQQANPNYDFATYATPEERAFRGSRRGGLFGAFDRVGSVVENNLIKPIAPYVQDTANFIGTPEGMVSTIALMAGIPYFPGMTEAGLVAAAETAGISTAELAGYQAAAAAEIASGGISGGAGGGLLTSSIAPAANALAPAANALAPAANALAPSAPSSIPNYLAPLLGAAAQIGGGAMADRSITDAANTAAASADKNLAFQREMFNTIRADQEPFRAAGVSALGKLSPLMDYKKFSMDDFRADPGYNFRFTQGQRGLDASAAARGGLQSGAALKAATAFGQEMGSQEYNNAFNRYGIERDRAINPLMQAAGFGQTATNNMQTGATNYGNIAGQIMQNAGDTAANANLARGSTYANTGNQLAQMLARYGRG